jgi:SsrA-binding protein
MVKDKKYSAFKVIAMNRKARYNFQILEEIEAGIVLFGSEVKSLRAGESNITDSYAEVKDGEVLLINGYIKEYNEANRFNHESRRVRKLLLHRKEINKMHGAILRKGMTVIPLKLYFNEQNKAKILLGMARGKKLHDKRASEKEKDWNRQKNRLLKSAE